MADDSEVKQSLDEVKRTKTFYEEPMKQALLAAKSMCSNEDQIVTIRFSGVLPQPSLETNFFHHDHQIARVKETILTESGRTATIIVRILSVFSLNLTEVLMTIENVILAPNQIVKYLMYALDKHSSLEHLTFIDAKTNFQFRRPNTQYGWRLRVTEIF